MWQCVCGPYTCLSIHMAAGSADDDTVVYMEDSIAIYSPTDDNDSILTNTPGIHDYLYIHACVCIYLYMYCIFQYLTYIVYIDTHTYMYTYVHICICICIHTKLYMFMLCIPI